MFQFQLDCIGMTGRVEEEAAKVGLRITADKTNDWQL